MRKQRNHNNLMALVFGLTLFLLTRKLVVNALVEDTAIDYSNLDIKIEKDEKGYSQLKTYHNEKVISQTDEEFSHAEPSISGENIVWMSQIDSYWQIFMQNIPSKETIQITHYGNNVNPIINGNKIVWEKLENGVWQIYLFDNYKLKKITNSLVAKQIIFFEDDKIIFHQKSSDNKGWMLYLYDILNETTLLLSDEMYSSTPLKLENIVTWIGTNNEGLIYRYKYDLTSGTKEFTEITNIRTEDFSEPKPPEEQKATMLQPALIEQVAVEDIYEELEIIEEVEESTESDDALIEAPLDEEEVLESTESQI